MTGHFHKCPDLQQGDGPKRVFVLPLKHMKLLIQSQIADPG